MFCCCYLFVFVYKYKCCCYSCTLRITYTHTHQSSLTGSMDESNEISCHIHLLVFKCISWSLFRYTTLFDEHDVEQCQCECNEIIRKNFSTRQMISGAHFYERHNRDTQREREIETEIEHYIEFSDCNWKHKESGMHHSLTTLCFENGIFEFWSSSTSTEQLWRIILSTAFHPTFTVCKIP